MKVVICCEKQDELIDLECILEELRNCNRSIEFALIDLSKITGSQIKPNIDMYKNIYEFNCDDAGDYRAKNFLSKLTVVLKVALFINKIIKIEKSSILLTGVGLVFFRIIYFLKIFTKVKVISYIRSNFTTNDRGISILPKFIKFLILKIGVFKPCAADCLLCIDEASSAFIKNEYYKNSKINIKTIGSISSFNLNKRGQRNNSISYFDIKEKNTVCFITSAFDWHGNDAGHEFQSDILRRLLLLVSELETKDMINVQIKVHPRDRVETYLKLYPSAIIVGNENFLNCETIYISMLSTLSLELRDAGYKSTFVCNNKSYNFFENWYKCNNVKPLNIDGHEFIDALKASKSSCIESEKNNPAGIAASIINDLCW